MQFVIASHGKMASGVLDTLNMLVGDRRKVLVLDAYVDGEGAIQEHIDTLLGDITEPIIAMTDIAGGSVNREIMLALRNREAFVVTDFNLALLLELISLSDDEITEQRINECIELCKNRTQCFSMIEKETNDD